MNKNLFIVCLIAIGTNAVTLNAQSPIDKSQSLKKIEGEFGLADGAAWDGSWSLTIPDVRGQALYRYHSQEG